MEEKKPAYKRPVYWLVGVSTFILLSFATIITGGVTFFQLYVMMPDQAYSSVIDGDWEKFNPRLMAFKTPTDFDRAETRLFLERTASKNPNDKIVSSYLLASLYEYQGKNNKATAEYQETLKKIDSSWYQSVIYKYFKEDIHASLAIIYYEDKKPAEALAQLDLITEMDLHANRYLLMAMRNTLEDPERADFHFTLGKELSHVLKLKQARAEMQTAERLSTDPDLKLRIHNHLKTKMPRSNKDLSPMVRYYTLAGDTYEYDTDLQDLKQAAYYYERVISQAPDFELAYHQLSNIYHKQAQYGKAVEYARKTVELNPDFYLAHLTMGDVELDRENYKAAAAHFKNAQSIVATLKDQYHVDLSANIENQLGFAYESLEQSREAVAHYKKALQTATEDSDDHAYAKDALQRLKEFV